MLDELEFEKPIVELENRLIELRAAEESRRVREEIARIEEKRSKLQQKIYGSLSAWQRLQIARHPKRPHTLDLIPLLFDDWIELHGDRAFADDKAIVGGLARFEGEPVVVLGHQKGRDTRENIARNFGMPHPEGYRKALRLMQLAGKFGKPIITLIDTPGAYPGLAAEERGQAEAIARNLREMAGLPTPIVCVVTGEGGSGGALALAVADRVVMQEHAWYSVISPEGCASILFRERTPETVARSAALLRLTADDLAAFGVVDEIVREPGGGAHRQPARAAVLLGRALERHLRALGGVSGSDLVASRYARYRRIGTDLPSV
jgi:acetyl-CoA carboxylase carboxyl transferase subunit alpha